MRAYLQLIRLPTVFTAIADVVLGMMLTQRGITPLPKFLVCSVRRADCISRGWSSTTSST
jgi:hypothetical protein